MCSAANEASPPNDREEDGMASIPLQAPSMTAHKPYAHQTVLKTPCTCTGKHSYFGQSPVTIFQLIFKSKSLCERLFWSLTLALLSALALINITSLFQTYIENSPVVTVSISSDDSRAHLPNLTVTVEIPWLNFFPSVNYTTYWQDMMHNRPQKDETVRAQAAETLTKQLEKLVTKEQFLGSRWDPELIYYAQRYYSTLKWMNNNDSSLVAMVRNHKNALDLSEHEFYAKLYQEINRFVAIKLIFGDKDANCSWVIAKLEQTLADVRIWFQVNFRLNYTLVTLATRTGQFRKQLAKSTFAIQVDNGPSITFKLMKPTNARLAITAQYQNSEGPCSELTEHACMRQALADYCAENHQCIPYFLLNLAKPTTEICSNNTGLCFDATLLEKDNFPKCNRRVMCEETFYSLEATREGAIREQKEGGYIPISQISLAPNRAYPIFKSQFRNSVFALAADLGGTIKFWLDIGMTAIIHLFFFYVTRCFGICTPGRIPGPNESGVDREMESKIEAAVARFRRELMEAQKKKNFGDNF